MDIEDVYRCGPLASIADEQSDVGLAVIGELGSVGEGQAHLADCRTAGVEGSTTVEPIGSHCPQKFSHGPARAVDLGRAPTGPSLPPATPWAVQPASSSSAATSQNQ